MKSLQFETDIIWLEDISKLPYVRCFEQPVRNRRGTPGKCHFNNEETRLIGYANLSKDAPCNNWYSVRRIFTIRREDERNPVSIPQDMPTEAVDPRTVKPGIKGVKTINK